MAEIAQQARACGLTGEAVHIGVVHAAVLLADRRPNEALREMKLITRDLGDLMRKPDDSTLTATCDFAVLSMDLGMHGVSETWLGRIADERDRLGSHTWTLRELSAYERLRVELGLSYIYLEHEDEAVSQFRRAALLGRTMVERSSEEVWRCTGVAFEMLASALLGTSARTPLRQCPPRSDVFSRAGEQARCLMLIALAQAAAVEGSVAGALRLALGAYRSTDNAGLALLSIELNRLVACTTRELGDKDNAAEHDRQWRRRWSAYEWSARLRTAEFLAG
ncbi:hypothetical protein ACIRG5_47265 [Lentzea sp. NPDC102401]|uniref:hypothetical protein n=1 Tax=Lentzea sp. NPDC102401 TaxID=3364128 RepID=UPI00381D5E72